MAYEPELTLARQPSMAAFPKAGEGFAQLRAPAAPATAVAVSERNPYRFGRRRSSAIR
jgi:hypothetical protein